MTKRYPKASVSRTLDPTSRSFTTVVGKHDRRITDADINLIQDVQDLKNQMRIDNQIFSGALAYSPYVFDPTKENIFKIPAFDVMFNGEVVSIGGANSPDPSFNSVTLPSPGPIGAINNEQASIYVVFVELWYQWLDPVSGAGYFTSGGQNFMFPNGCVQADSSTLIPDDVIDPFQGLNTTSRSQIQWKIRVAPISLFYDFTQYRYGLDPGANLAYETIFGQAYLSTAPNTASLTYAFTNMGTVNGDYGLWRAGDGAPVPVIPTLDGYTYAIPLAVVFQRTTGLFNPAFNPFGCGAPVSNSSGTLATISGRYDNKFADAIYPSDVVDTRMTVSMDGYDWNKLVNNGFVDLVNGNSNQKISRGETPGNLPTALASMPSYTVSLGPTAIPNTESLGPFDGFMNGFSTDNRTFYTTKAMSISDKVVGTIGTRWTQGDAVEVSVESLAFTTAPIISSVVVQGLATVADGTGSLTPVLLLGNSISGQVVITGLGTRKIQVTIAQNLQNTAFDPGIQNLYLTIGVMYGVQSLVTTGTSGYSTVKVPASIEGGVLFDAESLTTYSVFGVSDYTTLSQYFAKEATLTAYNPQYSNKVFGTRAIITANAADGVAALNGTTTTFTLTVNNIGLRYSGLYAIKAVNQISQVPYTILSNSITAAGLVVVLSGLIPAYSVLEFSILLEDTAQMGYNAPVKAISSIEETVLIGNCSQFRQMDTRVQIVSNELVGGNYVIILASKNGRLTGISGDDINKLLFIQVSNGSGGFNYVSYPVSDVKFFNAFATVTVPSVVNSITTNFKTTPFFMVGAFNPGLNANSTLAFSFDYVPYQGEGQINRDYSIVHSEEMAYVTTNGTGAAPIIGLKDVYPFNRELPIATLLPSQITWSDSSLGNEAIATYFGSNYDAKRFNNVEHTFATPIVTNDFIEPIGGWKRKKIRLSTPSGRGFSKAFPHVGFAIRPPTPQISQSNPVTSTMGQVTIYVNNITGNDSYDGLTTLTPKATIPGALNALPGVIRHQCYIFLVATAQPYNLAQLTLEPAMLGDGEVNQINHYCISNIAFTVQNEGRLYIGREPSATDRVLIDATGYTAKGDGPTSAFVVSDSRVIFNGIEFRKFVDAAIYTQAAYVELVDCLFNGNLVSGSFSNGSSVVTSRCSLKLNTSGSGFIVSNSDLQSSATHLEAMQSGINSFYVAERSASITLQNHSSSDEVGLSNSVWSGTLNAFVTKYETVVQAKLSSSVICNQDFSTTGSAKLQSNSVLTKSPVGTTFAGGISQLDGTSVISTDNS